MTLTFQALNDLRSAILSMANLKFSAGTSRKLASNLKSILACAPLYQQIHDNVYRQNRQPEKDSPEYEQYIQDFKAAVESETTEIELSKLDFEELNIGDGAGKNQVPLGVIVALDPILEGLKPNALLA